MRLYFVTQLVLDVLVVNWNNEQVSRKTALAKHAMNDSIFTNLFRDPAYAIQLYRVFHPEDHDAKAEDITIVTLQNVLVNDFYNDLGFKIGNRLLILVEAQSTSSDNILVRAFLYMAKTIQNHIWETGQNVYSSKQVSLPKPEVYVIYTGTAEKLSEDKSLPKEILLSRDFFHGESGALEVKVNMVYDGQEGDIVYQYVMFTKIYREQRIKYGRDMKAVQETIRICKDRNVLKEYLQSHESEAMDIMITLFDYEKILDLYVKDEKRALTEETKAAKEDAKAANNRAEQAEDNIKQAVVRLYRLGLSIPLIAQSLSMSMDDVQSLVLNRQE